MGIVSSIGTALHEAGRAIFTDLWNGIKSVWDGIAGWVSGKVSWLVDKLTFWDNGTAQMSRSGGCSHASGLADVPYDNYPANLHRNEVVINDGSAKTLLDDVRKIADGASGNSGPQTFHVSIELDGQTFARKTYTYNKREANLRGGSLVEVSG